VVKERVLRVAVQQRRRSVLFQRRWLTTEKVRPCEAGGRYFVELFRLRVLSMCLGGVLGSHWSRMKQR
jgi:hypothetical protein